jgi:hypothetical protein
MSLFFMLLPKKLNPQQSDLSGVISFQSLWCRLVGILGRVEEAGIEPAS